MPLSGFGMGEMILIAMLVLIVFGPKRLPEITRTIGKGIREFKKGMNEIQRELETADREARWSAPKTSEPNIAGPGVAGGAAATGAGVAGTATAEEPGAPTDDEASSPDVATASADPAEPDESAGGDAAQLELEAHQEPPTPRTFVDPAEEFVDPWATDSSKPSMPPKTAPAPAPKPPSED